MLFTPDRRADNISYIIIDGYNLTGISHSDLAGQRERLIAALARYKKLKNHDITLVFDGWKSGGHTEEKLTTGGINVIYSRIGEKADTVIKNILSRTKREWIVVSSDRDIREHAWSSGSVPVPSETFMDILENAERTISGNYELLEEDDNGEARKGNPRRPSKKDKALNRVLRKL